jgi:hypothetical protein
MTTPPTLTKIEEHVTTVTEITKTYDSTEMLKEATELASNPQEILDATRATPQHLVQEVGAELAREDPNWVRIAIYVVLALIPTLGTFFGMWFGVPR